ncbi:MAG: hypothetical protein ACXVJX_13490 [Acidimicrobiia bacterium]
MKKRLRYSLALLAGLAILVGAACAPRTGVYTGTPTLTTGVYKIGPFNLAAMDQPGSESNATQANVPKPPGNVAIKSIEFDLVDASGNPVPRMDVHLHYLLLMNAAHTSPICSGEEQRFAGSGAERTPMSLSGSYAYVSNSGDRWDSLWHIMNMMDMPMTVYIQYRVGWVPVTDPSAARPVTPFFLDVTGCGTNAEFDVPGNGGPGGVFTKSRTYTAPWDGVLVGIGGHLHGGGIDMTIQDDSNGLIGCRSVAHYDEPEPMDFPSSITPCDTHDYVHAGGKYTMTARYDNSQPYSAVMGIMLGYVWKGTPPAS